VPVEVVVAVAGLISSFLSGLLGIGGGIVLTPLLLYAPQLLGAQPLSVKIVTGLTVVQAISGSVLGAQRHFAYGNVSTRLVLTMGPPAAVASLIGALLSHDVSDQVLLGIFAAFSLLGAVFLVLLGCAAAEVSQITGALLVFALLVMPAATAQQITARPVVSFALTIGLGLVTVWLGLAAAYFSVYPVGFFVTSLAFALYVLVRFARVVARRMPAPAAA